MYILEGNIGVGKSTFLKLISLHQPDISIIQEPANNWILQKSGQSLLKNFYENPSRWAYTLETFAMMARTQDHLREQFNKNPNRIMERSIHSGHYCFAKNGFKNGYFNGLEWEIYLKWVDFLMHKNCRPPKGFIYLQSNPKICFQRIKKRGRKEEASITMDYLEQIHTWHELFLAKKENLHESLKNVPVLILDCNKEFEIDEEVLQDYTTDVKTFLQQTQGKDDSTKYRAAISINPS